MGKKSSKFILSPWLLLVADVREAITITFFARLLVSK